MKTILLALSAVLTLAAQNEQDVASGKALFRSNCAFCHGLTAAGGRGPSLISERLIRNTSDGEIQAIIKNGIAGTTMPAFSDLQKDDLEHLTGYIRNLAGTNVKPAAITGNPGHGQQVYSANGCANCHRIGETGSVYGPELTRIGGARSVEYLKQSIVDPSADIPTEYEGRYRRYQRWQESSRRPHQRRFLLRTDPQARPVVRYVSEIGAAGCNLRQKVTDAGVRESIGERSQ